MSEIIQPSRGVTITLWVLRIIVAALFLFAGVLKLIGAEMEVDVFNQVGLGQWFRYVTGVLEVGGAALTLIPATSAFGVLILLVVDLGAFVAQVTSLHQDRIHPIVIGVVLLGLLYAQRRQILGRLGG